tara:strand:+ start:86 stop:709 length:624 start_codon:yes stop_codon:yes gene_type:complete
MDNNTDTRYLNGKIYELICDKTNQKYCGSTFRKLNERLSEHKSKYNTCSSKEIIKNGNFRIELLELYPCQSRRELEAREQEWIDQGIYINDIRSFNSEEYQKEYEKKYRENNIENLKEYREINSEKIREQRKEYKQINSENIKENDKQYYENNSEKIKEQQKEYRENNSEKLNEKFNCDCGGKYTFTHKSSHFKTKKHIHYINNLEI